MSIEEEEDADKDGQLSTEKSLLVRLVKRRLATVVIVVC